MLPCPGTRSTVVRTGGPAPRAGTRIASSCANRVDGSAWDAPARARPNRRGTGPVRENDHPPPGVVAEEAAGEANLSAEDQASGQTPRLPASDEHQSRAARAALPPPEGPTSAVGLIGPVRDRATFVALRRSATVGRCGAVAIRFSSDVVPPNEGEPPLRVAYSVGKRVGSAVERNRVRRRLREIMAQAVRTGIPTVAPGAYLVIAGPAATALSYKELGEDVSRALESINTHRQSCENGVK